MALRKIWVPFSVALTLVQNTRQISTNLLANFETEAAQETIEATVLRVRGFMYVHGLTVGSEAQMAVGLHVDSDAAFTAGAASMQRPDREFGDWMWYHQVHTDGRAIESSSGVFTLLEDIYPLDTKAMRKVERNQKLFFVFATLVGTNMEARIMGRVLLGLH